VWVSLYFTSYSQSPCGAIFSIRCESSSILQSLAFFLNYRINLPLVIRQFLVYRTLQNAVRVEFPSFFRNGLAFPRNEPGTHSAGCCSNETGNPFAECHQFLFLGTRHSAPRHVVSVSWVSRSIYALFRGAA